MSTVFLKLCRSSSESLVFKASLNPLPPIPCHAPTGSLGRALRSRPFDHTTSLAAGTSSGLIKRLVSRCAPASRLRRHYKKPLVGSFPQCLIEPEHAPSHASHDPQSLLR